MGNVALRRRLQGRKARAQKCVRSDVTIPVSFSLSPPPNSLPQLPSSVPAMPLSISRWLACGEAGGGGGGERKSRTVFLLLRGVEEMEEEEEEAGGVVSPSFHPDGKKKGPSPLSHEATFCSVSSNERKEAEVFPSLPLSPLPILHRRRPLCYAHTLAERDRENGPNKHFPPWRSPL